MTQTVEGHAGHFCQFEESLNKTKGGDANNGGTCWSLVAVQRNLKQGVKVERESLKAVSLKADSFQIDWCGMNGMWHGSSQSLAQ